MLEHLFPERILNPDSRSDSSMVVRRGQAVKFTARLNRNFDESLGKVALIEEFSRSLIIH